MSDLIDRQIAISAICNACGKIDCDKMDKCEKLQLPPASNSGIPNSSDTISRAKAIEAINKALDRQTLLNRFVRKVAIDAIKQLPPAQSETAKRIIGKSKDGMTLWYQCDMCNEPVDAQDNFCRECGRRLIDE